MSSEIKRYFEILEQLVADECQLEEKADQQFYNRVKWFRYLQCICMTCASIGTFLWIFAWLKSPWLKEIASFFLAVAFLVFIITLLKVSSRKSSGLGVAKYCGEVDYKYLSLLTDLSEQTLQLGCLELEYGRSWSIKGLSALIGVVEKVGLIPSVLSLIALYTIPDKLPDWATPVVVFCGLLYMLSFLSQERLTRVERMIGLTKLALKLKGSS